MSEFEFLDELERRGLIVGVEHDAAEIDGLVVTQDTLVEGVHFRFDLLDWHELGFRAAAVNISDLATHVVGDQEPVYVMILEVDVPPGGDPEAIGSALKVIGSELGVDVAFNPMEADTL